MSRASKSAGSPSFTTQRDNRVLPSVSRARPWWWPLPLSIPAHIRLIVLLTCRLVLSVPQTTSPALLYTATFSHFPIGGRVVVGTRVAKHVEPQWAARREAHPIPWVPQ